MAWGASSSQMQGFQTSYVNFGTATAQRVELSQKSSNTDSGQLWQYSRKYFDRVGQVYKETASGEGAIILLHPIPDCVGGENLHELVFAKRHGALDLPPVSPPNP